MPIDYKAFYDEAPVGYFTTNASHIIINANRFFLDLVKKNADEVIGKMGLQDFLSIGGKMYFQTHYFPLLQLTGKIKEINLEILTQDKIKIPILINTNRSDEHEGSPIYHSVVFNITQRSLFEKELIAEKKKEEELTIQLKQTNDKILLQTDIIINQNKALDRLNGVKDKFFRVIAHDIKGPLSQLSSFVSLINDHIDALSKEDLKEMSNQLNETMVNTVDLVDNLFEWAQSQMKGYSVTTSNFLIEEVVSEAVNSHTLIAQKKQVNIGYTLDGNPRVTADKNQLHFIFRNLITNAIKFTPEGGNINIDCHELDENKVKIAVIDSGVGMNEEFINIVFEDSLKTSKEGTNGEKGNGIGLLLVKEFVAMNNGTIEVSSKEGKGSTFTVTLDSNY